MHKHIMLVDDERFVLDSLRRMLRPQRSTWNLVCVDDPSAAWDELHNREIDAVVSDIRMPGMDGLQLLGRIKASPRFGEVPVVMLTGLEDRSLKRQALDLGASDLLNKPVDPEDLVARIRSVLRLKAYQDELKASNNALERKVQERTGELRRSQMDVVWRLSKAAEQRDSDTGNHVIRVGFISREIAEAMGLDRAVIDAVFLTAPLHDIGKIGIPDAILTKSGPLTSEEWKVMKQHCAIGARILRDDTRAESVFADWLGHPEQAVRTRENPILQMAENIAWMHHEKWDGSGYPHQLVGEKIALEARIVAVADVFDALTSHRPYRAMYSEGDAVKILEEGVGRHFDPRVYAAFRAALPAIRSIRSRFCDGAPPTSVTDEAHNETGLVC